MPPTVPRIEETLTIDPPPEEAMRGPRCFMPSQTPVEPIDMTASQRSIVSSSTVAMLPMAALLISPSSRPYSLRMRLTTSIHCDSSATSSRAVTCRPGVPSNSAARAAHAWSSRSVSTRWAPSSASLAAAAAPSPPVAPVTHTTLSLIRSSTAGTHTPFIESAEADERLPSRSAGDHLRQCMRSRLQARENGLSTMQLTTAEPRRHPALHLSHEVQVAAPTEPTQGQVLGHREEQVPRPGRAGLVLRDRATH